MAGKCAGLWRARAAWVRGRAGGTSAWRCLCRCRHTVWRDMARSSVWSRGGDSRCELRDGTCGCRGG
eukprot:60991-Chlamydomonas_euryale.AAC.4